MYTTNSIIFMIITPFVKLYEKHFNKVEEYVNIINNYCKENNLIPNSNKLLLKKKKIDMFKIILIMGKILF